MNSFRDTIETEFTLNHEVPAHPPGPHEVEALTRFVSHLPEALEFPLFDTEQLTGLSADNCCVPWRVVQDGLPERRPNPKGANGDCILRTNAPCFILHFMQL